MTTMKEQHTCEYLSSPHGGCRSSRVGRHPRSAPGVGHCSTLVDGLRSHPRSAPGVVGGIDRRWWIMHTMPWVQYMRVHLAPRAECHDYGVVESKSRGRKCPDSLNLGVTALIHLTNQGHPYHAPRAVLLLLGGLGRLMPIRRPPPLHTLPNSPSRPRKYSTSSYLSTFTIFICLNIPTNQ